jgi:microcystin-dependent protein
MSQPYVGEIKLFAGSFAPSGWAMCQGQLMPISENDTLFNLIGTIYGGDGQETFGLPDLQGRVPIHMGQGPGISQTYQIGEEGGVESVTLSTQQIPVHNHAVLVTQTGQQLGPGGAYFATATSSQAGVNAYNNTTAADTPLVNTSLQPVGGNQPHDNIQPTLCVSYIISLFGIFPSQN